jgi:hypothetical protein
MPRRASREYDRLTPYQPAIENIARARICTPQYGFYTFADYGLSLTNAYK